MFSMMMAVLLLSEHGLMVIRNYLDYSSDNLPKTMSNNGWPEKSEIYAYIAKISNVDL